MPVSNNTIADAEKFIKDNPAAYEYMVNEALALRAQHLHVGMKYLLERARIYVAIQHNIDDFKINNNLSPVLARVMIEDVPELADVIKLREARADKE